MRALAAATMLVAACGFSPLPRLGQAIDARADGNADSAGGDVSNIVRHIAVTWDYVDVGGTSQACPTGINTVIVSSQEIDANDLDVGAPVQDTVTCSPRSVTTSALHASRYRVQVQIGANAHAVSLPSIVDVSTADGQYSTLIYSDSGYFTFKWKLMGTISATTLSCSQAGTPTVEIVSTNVNNPNQVFTDDFTCTDGGGTTSHLLAANYTVSISANNAQGQAVSDSNTRQATITAPNKVTDLGTITLTFANM